MKNLDALIEKTTSLTEANNRRHNSGDSPKSLTEKMFDIADKVTEKLDVEHANSKKTTTSKAAVKHSYKNITFSMPLEVEYLLNDLVKRYMMNTGEVGKKSHIICAALNMINKLSDSEFVGVVNKEQKKYK